MSFAIVTRFPRTRDHDNAPAPAAAPARTNRLDHTRWVRATHWIVTLSFFVLLYSGIEILMVHPRLYWGEVGNELTPAWLELPISRNYRHGGWMQAEPFFQRPDSPVSASRTYGIFNQNGWGRSLHFMAGWILVATGAAYLLAGIFSGHFRRHLLPRVAELRPVNLWSDIRRHLRGQIPPGTGGPQYGLLQKCSYVVVIVVALPGAVLTGLTMSPAITAAYPWLLDLFGGYQSARSIHFLIAVGLVIFVGVHVVMVARSGFRRQMRAMTIGGSHE